MEVAQHIGDDTSAVLCWVGEKTLGRLFNVLGEAIDDGEAPVETEENWRIHRVRHLSFEEISPVVAGNAGDRYQSHRPSCPYQRVVRSVCSVVPV